MHEDSLPSLQLAFVDQGLQRGDPDGGDRGGLFEREPCGLLGDPLLVGDDHIRERTARLDLRRAKHVVADIAELAARVGIQVFRTAYRRWLQADDNADLATLTETVMALLATIVPASASTILPPSVRTNPPEPSTASFR